MHENQNTDIVSIPIDKKIVFNIRIIVWSYKFASGINALLYASFGNYYKNDIFGNLK